MFGRVASWPKIIGAVVAGFGFSRALSAWTPHITSEGGSLGCDWFTMLQSVMLLAASYPIATGREWARRLLVVAVILIGLRFVAWAGFLLFEPIGVGHLSAAQAQPVKMEFFLDQLSLFLFLLTLLFFTVALLCHRDVVASFQRRREGDERI